MTEDLNRGPYLAIEAVLKGLIATDAISREQMKRVRNELLESARTLAGNGWHDTAQNFRVLASNAAHAAYISDQE